MGFKVGFSEVIITPKLNLTMGGYSARIGKATGVHDHLFARAVYFNYNGDESLLISTDLLSLSLKTIKYYRKLIYKKTGINENRIFLCALHNHSGPDTMGIITPIKGFFRRGLNTNYFLKLGKYLTQLAQDVKSNAFEALVGVKKELMEKRLIVNRREPLKNSKFDVGVIRFDDLQGNPRGFIVNYACHGTVLPYANTLYTAEYPGYIVRRIRARLGEKIGVVYLNGPCGDINPNLFDFNIDLSYLDANKKLLYDAPGHAKGTFTRAREIGYAIADKAVEISQKVKCVPIFDFKYKKKSYQIPISFLRYENSLSMALKHLWFKFKTLLLRAFWQVFKPTILIPVDYLHQNGKFLQVAEIHGIKLNDYIIIGIPGEVFSELGKRIITKPKIKDSFVVELANGSVGYLFPLNDYKKGGYEMFLSINPIGGTFLTNKAINLVNSFSKN